MSSFTVNGSKLGVHWRKILSREGFIELKQNIVVCPQGISTRQEKFDDTVAQVKITGVIALSK